MDQENTFDKFADKYEKIIPGYITLYYRDKRAAFICSLIRQGIILDVGCGTGLVLDRLQTLGFNAFGVEPSLGMLREMKELGRKGGICATSGFLPFKSDSFDLVSAIVILHHISGKEEIRRAISEMVRVVKPKGKILIWEHNLGNPYWPVLMRKLPWDNDVERLIPLKEILEDLEISGIREIKVYKKGFVADFMPQFILPLVKLLEPVAESAPLLKNLAAHNVVVATK
jgi:ubiquinone/menaquinone biosynthesis C-methylase UbiE